MRGGEDCWISFAVIVTGCPSKQALASRAEPKYPRQCAVSSACPHLAQDWMIIRALTWYASACFFELHHIVPSTVLWNAAIARKSLVKRPLLPDCALRTHGRVLLAWITEGARDGDLGSFRRSSKPARGRRKARRNAEPFRSMGWRDRFAPARHRQRDRRK